MADALRMQIEPALHEQLRISFGIASFMVVGEKLVDVIRARVHSTGNASRFNPSSGRSIA